VDRRGQPADGTQRLKFLVALRPGCCSRRWPRAWRRPSTACRRAGCWSTWSPAATPTSSPATASSADHAQRYAGLDEFMTIWREVLARSHAGERSTSTART
jgi:alkanesulfonate monooxygenase